MPSKAPITSVAATRQLQAVGLRIRAHRKAMRVSAIAAAQAASMSRVTWHRIESGEAAVTMGAYLNALDALGLQFEIADQAAAPPPADGATPAQVPAGPIAAQLRLADYPHLRELAWHVHGIDHLTPQELWDIYERHQRHLDHAVLTPSEQALVAALRQQFTGSANRD